MPKSMQIMDRKMLPIGMKITRADGEAKPKAVISSTDFGYSSLDFGAGERLEWFYEPISATLFRSTRSRVLQAEYHINRLFVTDGYARLDEFYGLLGITDMIDYRSRRYSESVGWSISDNSQYWIDFDHSKWEVNGKECFLIDAQWRPSRECLTAYY